MQNRLLIGYRVWGADGSLELIDVHDPRHPVEAGWIDVGNISRLVAGGDIPWAGSSGEPWVSYRAIELRHIAKGPPVGHDVAGLPEASVSCIAALGNRAFITHTLANSNDHMLFELSAAGLSRWSIVP